MSPSGNDSYFFSFYKESGLTSADALDRLKRALKIKKAGHCGTLDPMAEGLLVVAVNRATKLMRFVTDERKRYIGEFELGKRSPSYDIETPVETVDPHADAAQVDWERIKGIFNGKIRQIPPAYSAVRVEGVRSYVKARKGETVDLPSKEVEIFSLELTSLDKTHVSFAVECSKGTYVRSLVHDIGAVAGTGAVLSKLTRAAVGNFTIDNAVRLAEIREDSVKVVRAKLDMIQFMSSFPAVTVGETLYWRLRNGIEIRSLGLDLAEGPNAIFYKGAPLFVIEKEKDIYRYSAYLGE
ncbi:MAG TPA: tRNA pseudouridine(55) synthase TruB [bacterium]|nr:tRNA pseudouridine(55) synthase TruB [bacterium]